MAKHALSIIRFLLIAVSGANGQASWSGPSVAPKFNAHGISSLVIDGVPSAPGFLVGNTQGGLSDDEEAWILQVKSAADAGVKIFGFCPSGSDLAGETVQLSNQTRSMIDNVLAVAPHALLLPRIPMHAGPSFPKTVLMARNGSIADAYYDSLTSSWTRAAAPRMARLLELMDSAYPGRIAGVHLSQLNAGELTYNWQPGDFGYADYSAEMQNEFCKTHLTNGNCTAPTAAERLTPGLGNTWSTNRSAAYNLFLSMQIQKAIALHARAAKAAMGNKGLVIAFYGYLNELGDLRLAGSGHLALGQLLREKSIDGIVSPYKYDPLYREVTGTIMSMGPFDAPHIHGKLWISEDDSRTSFAKNSFARSCSTPACDRQLMRRNLITSVLHGSGLYQFDLTLAGWFGLPNRTADTQALWSTIGQARRTVEQLYNTEIQGIGLEPEIAVFLDDEAMGHLLIGGIVGESLSAQNGPARWLDPLPSYLAEIGAPVRHYYLRDLLIPGFIDNQLATIKMAVLPNAFKLTPELRHALEQLGTHRTLVYYYAPGLLDSMGAMNISAIADLVGCSIARGAGVGSLKTEIVAQIPVTVPGLVPLAGQLYAPSPEGVEGMDPWFYIPEGSNCSVLGRYYGRGQASLVMTHQKDSRVIFSAAPPTAAILRIFAELSGVHFYLAGLGDGIEAAGAGLLFRGGPAATSKHVILPPPTDNWDVNGENGEVVCKGCSGFKIAASPGDIQVWFVSPSLQSSSMDAYV